jgi:hypothetical protein
MSSIVQAWCHRYLRMIHVHNGIYGGLVRYELVFLNELLLVVRFVYRRHRSCVCVRRLSGVRDDSRGWLRLQLHLLDLRLDLDLLVN